MINNTKKNKLQIIQDLYSLERVNNYKQYCKNINNDDEVYELYFLNELLSTYFFNLISNIEIALRNKIHNAINICYASYNKNTKWYDYDKPNQRINIFHILKDKDNQLSNQIICELKKIENNKKDAKKKKDFTKIAYITKYKESILISRLSFGFWNYIIANNVDSKNKIIYNYDNFLSLIFNNHIAKQQFIDVSDVISGINSLRNRIAHHENIIKNIKNIEKNFNICKEILLLISNTDYRDYIFKKTESITNTNFGKILTRIKNAHK